MTETGTVNVTVDAVNDAPVNTLPSSYSINEDTSVGLTGISLSDVDAGSGTMTATFGVTAGTLTAGSSGGVTVSGSGTSALTLSGTLANLNTYLAGASRPIYAPVANFSGAVTLTLTTDDGGNTGLGGVQTSVNTSTITVVAPQSTSVPDGSLTPPPTIVMPAPTNLPAVSEIVFESTAEPTAESTTESFVIATVNEVRPLASGVIQATGGADKTSQKLSINSVLAMSEAISNREKLEFETAASFTQHRDVLPAEIGEWHGRTNDRISIKQADGTDLPKWLFEREGRLIVKERPADVEYVYLQVKMTSSQGVSELIFMRLNVITGELTVVAPEAGMSPPETAPSVPPETP